MMIFQFTRVLFGTLLLNLYNFETTISIVSPPFRGEDGENFDFLEIWPFSFCLMFSFLGVVAENKLWSYRFFSYAFYEFFYSPLSFSSSSIVILKNFNFYWPNFIDPFLLTLLAAFCGHKNFTSFANSNCRSFWSKNLLFSRPSDGICPGRHRLRGLHLQHAHLLQHETGRSETVPDGLFARLNARGGHMKKEIGIFEKIEADQFFPKL